MSLKIDLHVHTCYSYDAVSSLRDTILHAKRERLNGIAVTDHDTAKGARRALKLANRLGFLVIPGVEVSTLHGHVLGLNVTTSIPRNLSLVESVGKIHEAGGIAVIAHPRVFIKPYVKQQTASTSHLDGVEVINSSAFPFFLSTHLSLEFAQQLDLPQTAGSDAHHAGEIGAAYTLVNADSEVDEIIEAIRNGAVAPFGRSISWEKRIKRGAYSLKRLI